MSVSVSAVCLSANILAETVNNIHKHVPGKLWDFSIESGEAVANVSTRSNSS